VCVVSSRFFQVTLLPVVIVRAVPEREVLHRIVMDLTRLRPNRRRPTPPVNAVAE
jgi:hypothetical protein